MFNFTLSNICPNLLQYFLFINPPWLLYLCSLWLYIVILALTPLIFFFFFSSPSLNISFLAMLFFLKLCTMTNLVLIYDFNYCLYAYHSQMFLFSFPDHQNNAATYWLFLFNIIKQNLDFMYSQKTHSILHLLKETNRRPVTQARNLELSSRNVTSFHHLSIMLALIYSVTNFH